MWAFQRFNDANETKRESKTEISSSDTINHLMSLTCQDNITTVVGKLLGLLESYISLISSPHAKRKKVFFSLLDANYNYSFALRELDPNICELGANINASFSIELHSDQDSKKIANYLLLHFHLTHHIHNFIDLMNFRDIFLHYASALAERGYHISNKFGETIRAMVVHLNQDCFLIMNEIKKIAEKHLPIFLKRFILKIVAQENDPAKKAIMTQIIEMVETTPELERNYERTKPWFHLYRENRTPERKALIDRNRNLTRYANDYPIIDFYSYFVSNEGYNFSTTAHFYYPIQKLINLFNVFDHLLISHPNDISIFTKEARVLIFRKLGGKLIPFCGKQTINFLEKTDQTPIINSHLRFFPRTLCDIVEEYLEEDEKNIVTTRP